jgi:hypothetical protein
MEIELKACELCGQPSLIHVNDRHCSLCVRVLMRLALQVTKGEIR